MITLLRKGKDNLYILLLVLLLSCTKVNEKYVYSLYYENDSIPSEYFVKKIQYENNYRKEEFFSYENEKLDLVESDKFKVVKGGLDKVIEKDDTTIIKPYLTILNDTCTEYFYNQVQVNDMLATKLCYLGQEDIFIRDKQYKNAYKFKKIKGTQHSIESVVYYDKNFILIKEEYVNGYTTPYKMVQLDTVLITH